MCRLAKCGLTRTRKVSFHRLFCLVIFLGFFSLILQLYSNSNNVVTMRISDIPMSRKIIAVLTNSTASVGRSFIRERYLRDPVAEKLKNDWKHNMTGRGLKARGKVVPDTDNIKNDLKHEETGTGVEPLGKGMYDTGNVNNDLNDNQASRGVEARSKVVPDLENLQSHLKYQKTGRDVEAWGKGGSDIANVKNHLKYYETGRGLEVWGRVVSETENVKNHPKYYKNGRGLGPRGKLVSDIENIKNSLKFYRNGRGLEPWGKVVYDTENVKKDPQFYKNDIYRDLELRGKVLSDIESVRNRQKFYKNDRGLEPRGKVMSDIDNIKNSQKFYKKFRGLEPRGKVMYDIENIKNRQKFYKKFRGLEPQGKVMSDIENIKNSQKFYKKFRGLEPRGKAMSDIENIKEDPKYDENGRDPEAWGKELHDTGSVEKDPNLNKTGRGLAAWGKMVWPRAAVMPPWNQRSNTSPLCPHFPRGLYGYMPPDIQARPKWTDIIRLNPRLEPGGHYQPAECKARHRVAIIVPYRDREEHLRTLLYNLHPMLQRQQLDYFILVVELAQPTKFNRGMLLNIGAVEALGLWDVQCFIFHDVDLLPENDYNLYTCPETPRHMSAAVDKFQYKLPYRTIFGGVGALTVKDFYQLNGYSNVYFGWGGEDDDFSARITSTGLSINRYSLEIARYQMIKHERDKSNEINDMRFLMLRSIERRQPTDGLNSLQYQVQKVEFRPSYTWILVSINQDQVLGQTLKWRMRTRAPQPRNSAFRRRPVFQPSAIRRGWSWRRGLHRP